MQHLRSLFLFFLAIVNIFSQHWMYYGNPYLLHVKNFKVKVRKYLLGIFDFTCMHTYTKISRHKNINIYNAACFQEFNV